MDFRINKGNRKYDEYLHGHSLRSCLFGSIMFPEKVFALSMIERYQNPCRDFVDKSVEQSLNWRQKYGLLFSVSNF